MNEIRKTPCSLGRETILLGKQGEENALRLVFDCAEWLASYPAATIKLFVCTPGEDEYYPVIGKEGTNRVWIVGARATKESGNGVIELQLVNENTGSVLKSATGYTTVRHSPSANTADAEEEAGYVRYDKEQILTEEQKNTARNNIGAGTGNGTGGIVQETDPTVPAWAKAEKKPTYTAEEVGADPAGTAAKAVGEHDVDDEAHEDIRALIVGLTNRLNALADSDDTTLDQMTEVVAYIKNNKSLIDGITTGKISTSDIVDNLTTNVSTKVLSAAQGVKLKALIDAIVVPTSLPNPQPIVINGQSYDGSKAVTMTIQAEGGGAAIDTTLTKGGQAADAAVVGEKLNELNEAIDAKGDPTDEQVSTAVNAFLTENPVNAGMTATQLALLKTLGNYLVFSDATTGQAIFDNLITELEKTVSGDDTGGGDEPDTPDTPDEPEIPTSYTITNSLTNVSTNNNATSVDANAAYTATLTPDSGYSIGSVTITMGGVNVTDTVYADGVINIEAVTGDVLIVATGLASDNLITAEVLAQSGAGSINDGTQANGTDTILTPFIAVEPGTTYKTNIGRYLSDGSTYWNHKIAEYDAEQVYIKAVQMSGNTPLSSPRAYTITENTHYIRCILKTALLNPYFGKSGVIV